MAVPRFYLHPLAAGRAVLTNTEAAHAAGSRRLRPGDAVILFDGRGHEAPGIVRGARRQRVEIELREVTHRDADAPVQVTVAAAVAKGPRQDELLKSCTEVGAAAIWPMLTEHSEARPRADRPRRWRRITIEAAKQAQRAWLPALEPVQTLADVLARAGEFDLPILADPAPEQPALPVLLDEHPGANKVLVLIGPEGGLSENEVSAAVQAGLRAARLGPTVLRVETAAAVATAIILAHALTTAQV